VRDEEGQVVRRIAAPASAGLQRVAWDLRLPPANPTEAKPAPTDNLWSDPPQGPMLAPGRFTVTLTKRVDGKEINLAGPEAFTAEPLGQASLPAKDRAALLAFQKKTARLQRAVLGTARALDEARTRLSLLKKAIDDTPGGDPRLGDEARTLENRLKDLSIELEGDSTRASRNEPTPPSITDRVQQVVGGHWGSTSDATRTHQRGYELAAGRFAGTLEAVRAAMSDLERLEDRAETAGAPWTPGRLPTWRQE
jgi:hypothetical protein